jgi:hypothetical protein
LRWLLPAALSLALLSNEKIKMGIIIGAGIGTVIGLIIANYSYQFFTDGNWIKAFEISFHQVTAVAATVGGVCITYALR